MIDFERFMTEYAANNGVDAPIDFDEGCCHLPIAGQDLGFMQLPEGDAILVWSALKACPADDAEAFYRLLLRSNFMGQGIREGAFSISEDNVAYAHRTFPDPEANPAGFAAAVTRFVEDIKTWYDAIEHAHFVVGVANKVAADLDRLPSDCQFIRV